MPKKKQPIKTPLPVKNPEYNPDVIPEIPQLPEQETGIIPEEEPL